MAVADVTLEGYQATRLGGRVLVRFAHSAQPLAVQVLRGARQLMLRHFDGGTCCRRAARESQRRESWSDAMSLSAIPRPGVVWGSYPERDAAGRSSLQRVADGLAVRLELARQGAMRSQQQFVVAVRAALKILEPQWHADAASLRVRVAMRLNREGFSDAALIDGVALTAVVAAEKLGVKVYDTQIAAAWIMLHNGLAEMATGEGKTFASLLAAAPAALAGVPVHVMTANDYLVQRDSAQLKPGLRGARPDGRHDCREIHARRAASGLSV